MQAKIINQKSRDYGRVGTIVERGDPHCPYSICKVQFDEHRAGEYKVFSVGEVELLCDGRPVMIQQLFDFAKESDD